MILLLRWIIKISLLCLVAALGLWVFNNPGDIQLDWLGYRITTSFWVMAVAVLGTILVGCFLFWVWLKVFYNISLFGKKRSIKSQEKGLEALTKTIAAMSVRDYAGANDNLAQSRKLLGDIPLNTMLDAHLAAKSGDKAKALASLQAMEEAPQTKFLAKSSLSAVARHDGEQDNALAYAKDAYQLRPDMKDPALSYLGLLLKTGDYEEARSLVTQASRQKTFDKAESKHLQALVHYAAYSADGLLEDAAALKSAFTASPDFAPAYQYIVHLHQDGKERQALQALYKAWKVAPHAELTDILLHYFEEEQPTKLMKRGQVLLKMHPDHLETHLAMARLAMEAAQWDTARNHLKAALAISPQMRVFQLLARLEEEGMNDENAASMWLKRLNDAQTDPAWQCQSCGHKAQHWAIHCESCDSFDGYHWEQGSYAQASNDLLVLDMPKLA